MKRNNIIILAVIVIITMILTGCRSEVENQTITIEYNGKSYEGTYTGVLDNGVPVENGKFLSGDIKGKDFFAYSGSWEGGAPKGEGTLMTDNYTFSIGNGDVGVNLNGVGTYMGDVLDGLPNGTGALLYGDAKDDKYLYYEGDWESGEFKGEGKLDTKNYSTYGQINDDKDNKTSLLGTYRGTTENGLPNGEGSFRVEATNGDGYLTYEGEWKDGYWNGYGEVRFSDGASYDQLGNYNMGAYEPGIADIEASLGTMPSSCPYELSDEAYEFIDTNSKLFVEPDKDAIDKLGTKNFDMGSFKKNPKEYSPGFVEVNWLHIQQAIEEDFAGGKVTFVLAYDHSGNYYWLNCLWGSDAFVENSEIRAIFMPLGYSTYETVSGGTQWAISGVIVY